MSKYYRSTIMLEVLSDRPINGLEIQQILNECDIGECVLAADSLDEQIISREEMIEAMHKAGSDPSFFIEDYEDE